MIKNPIAKVVRTSAFKLRVIKPKKGKGSFTRKKFKISGD